MSEIEKVGTPYEGLVNQISETYVRGRKAAVIAVNSHLIETYWNVGRDIVEFEQNGSDRATYGSRLLENLSKDLALRHGKGFSESNLRRSFVLKYSAKRRTEEDAKSLTLQSSGF